LSVEGSHSSQSSGGSVWKEPLEFAGYPVTFTAARQARLQTAFPTGVCDWSKPSVDERPTARHLLDYGP